MEKNMLAGKTALPPSMLPGALPMVRPSTLWALQWSGPNQSLQNLMHFRYYASSMGRFLKPDNIITNIANPQSWNLYTYVNGNPANFNDPTGHLGNFPLSGKAILYNQTGHMELAPEYGGMWENPQEKGTMTLDASGSGFGSGGGGGYQTIKVQTGWTFKYYSTETEATLVATPVYALITSPVSGSSSGWLWSVYGRTIGFANRLVSAVPFSWLILTGNRHWGEYGTIIVENKFYTDILGANAVTYGNLIVIDPSFLRKHTEEEIRALFHEEYAHSAQYGMFGPYFYILYLADWLAFGYENQIFEQQARSASAPMPW